MEAMWRNVMLKLSCDGASKIKLLEPVKSFLTLLHGRWVVIVEGDRLTVYRQD